jgi:hypothetical protein
MMFVMGTSVVELTGMVVSEVIRAAVIPPGLFVDIPARPLRDVLLAFRSSISGLRAFEGTDGDLATQRLAGF